MSMTRAEAIDVLENGFWWETLIPVTTIEGRDAEDKLHEALDLAITALRGPTREMVERIFPGCKMCKPVCHKCKSYPLALYPQACKTCVEHSNFKAASNFCEDCGKPLTDETVDMMLERWKEAVVDEA